jgi:pSer/pThr/pTyr-binding forkhead associated (FHA) protein
VGGDSQKSAAVSAAPQARTAVELKTIIETERLGARFLLWRDGAGTQMIFGLGEHAHATIGRRGSNSVMIADDGEISRTHAELDLVVSDWTVADDGLSRNGTFVTASGSPSESAWPTGTSSGSDAQ